jgi:hypothetical protein
MRSTASARQLYAPDPVPSDPKLYPSYLQREFEKLANAVNAPIKLEVLHAEPSKPRDGDLLEADGTDLNPGSGAGLYIRRAGAWVFIG